MAQSESVMHATTKYDEQLAKRNTNEAFDVEAWYRIIQDQTFSTQFIPISIDQAQAFVHFFETRYTSTKSLDPNDIVLLEFIEKQLKEQVFNSTSKNFFVRLSARSPKDGKPLNTQIINRIYQEKLADLQKTHSNEYDTVQGKANMQLIASYYAQFHSLKVTNEIETLNLILSSERIYYDLNEVLDCEKVNHTWNNHIIVREWNDRLDPSMEFRCFVYQSKLTAISQYNHYCKYYHLQDADTIQRIKSTIARYWQTKIQPLLDPFPEKYANYVIDIGLIGDQFDCIVIEMNPFHSTTNPSLFDWTTDNGILRGDGHETEIRVRLEYYPYVEDYINFILELNNCSEEPRDNSRTTNERLQPYFVFLEKIKTRP